MLTSVMQQLVRDRSIGSQFKQVIRSACSLHTFSRQSLAVMAIFGVFTCFANPTAAQTRPTSAQARPQDNPSVAADEAAIDADLKAKALRYHQALQRRPAPGFLFDRFYDAWLEFSTLADLEQFLSQQANTSRATHDQVLLAFFFAKQGDDVKALAQFQTALAENPGSAATWYEKAAVAARTLDFDTALQDLAKAAELNAAASSPDKELGLKIAKQQASLLVRGGQIPAAMQAWEQLITANPNDEMLLEDIVEQQIGEGLLEQALATTDRLLEITKDPYQLVMRRMRKGDILQRAGKQPEALEVYGETLPRVGRDTWLERELVAQIAELFRRDDNLVGLKDHFAKLIESEPDRLALHKALARTMSQIGQKAEAIATLQKIVELTPGDRTNRENLIAALATDGRLDEAVAQQEALIGQFPTDAELSIKLAEYQKQRGQEDGARTALREYLTKSNHSEAAYLRAARTLEAFGLADDTRQMYLECLQRYEQSVVAREAYGTWLYQQNEKPAALELWQQMGAGADKQELLRIARLLSHRSEHAAAVELLRERLDSFNTDSIYLGQLIDASLAVKQFSETIPWLRRRAAISQTANDLENTIAQAVIVYRRLNQPEVLLDALREDVSAEDDVKRRSAVGAACVLSELLEVKGDSAAADQLLTQTEAGLAGLADAGKALELLASQRIRLLMVRQDWTQAAETARKLVESPGGRQSVHLRRLVELYMRDNQPEQALAWIEQWKQSSPGSVMPWINESQLLSRLAREDESVRVLRQASRRFPQDTDLATMLAEKYTETGQAREAERIYWRQFEQSEDPADRLRWVEQLARVKTQLGQTDELIGVFRERQKSNPESIEPLLALALIYRQADNYEDRRAVLMEASRKQPDNLQLLLETARLEETTGDWQDALVTLERALPLDNSGKVAQQMAKISFDYGDYQRGLQILRVQLDEPGIGPRDVESLIDAMLKAGQWETARELLMPQLVRWPDDWRLSYIRGVIEVRLEAYETAREIFLSLLSVDSDLPGLKANLGSTSYGRHPYANHLPKAIQSYSDLRYHADEPLSHEDRDSYRGYYYQHGGTYLMLPNDSRACRYYALWHLVFMNRGEEDAAEDRLAIVRKMGEGGIDDADLFYDLLLDVSPNNHYSDQSIRDELFDRYADRPALWMIYVFSTINGTPNTERLAQAVQVLEETNPGTAFLAALILAKATPTELPAEIVQKLPSLLDRVGTESNTNYMVAMGAMQLFRQDRSDLPEELNVIKEKLDEMFLQWYEKLDANSDPWERAMLLSTVTKSVADSNSPEKLLKFLEGEIDRAENSNTSPASNPYSRAAMYGRYGYDEGLINLLKFPPTELLSLPEVVTSLPEAISGKEPWEYGEEAGEMEAGHAGILRQVAEQTSRPLLRAVLQFFMGRSQELMGEADSETAYAEMQATLESMLEVEPNNADALILAASLATHQKRWIDAAALLERVAMLPLPQDRRKAVDSAAVALAVKGQVVGLDQPEQSPLVAVARGAALRLRRHQMDNDQRLELLHALESLSLKEEAGQMESRMTQTSPTPVPSLATPFSSGGNVRTTSVERIVELVQSDKKDAAFRLLTQDLNSYARQRLMAIDGPIEQDYEIREFVSIVKQLQVASEFLQHIEQESADRFDLLGFAHELFGERAQAIQFYQKFSEANPGRAAVKLRTLLLQLLETPEELTQHLAVLDAFEAKTMPEVGSQILSRLPTLPLTFEQRMQVVAKLVSRAEVEAQVNVESAAWLATAWPVLTENTLLDAPKASESSPDLPRSINLDSIPSQSFEMPFGIAELGQALDNAMNRLPPLYFAGSVTELSDEELGNEKLIAVQARITAARKMREDLHERTCALLLNVPETANDAFFHWLARREARKEIDHQQAVGLAKSVLEQYKAGAGSGSMSAQIYQQRAMQQMMHNMQFSGQGRAESPTWKTVPLRTPMQYITSQLAQNRTPENDDLIAELAEKFRGRRLTDLATELQRRFELNAVAENEFGNLVKTMSTQGTERRRAPTVDISGLVLEIYEQRELKVDLMPTLLEIVREASQQRNWNQVSNTQAVFLQYLRKQASVHGPSVVVTALAGLAEAIVGDQEQQAALIEKYGNKSSLPPNRGEGAPYATYLGYLASMIRIPELVFPALAEAQRYRAGEHVDIKMAGYRVAEYFSSERSADKVIALLDGSPFLNRLEEFQPLQIENENISTVLGNLLDRLRYGEWSSRGAIAKKLKAREQNFGTRLFVAVMEADRWEGLSVKDVHEALKPDLEVLASLPEERLIAISILVEEVSKNYRRRAYTSTAGDPEVEAVLAKASGAAPAFDKLMAATSLSSLGVESYSYGIQEYAIQVLAPLLKDRPQDFVAGLNHLMKLSRSVLRRQNENATVLIRRILRESVSQSPIEGVAATILVASEPGGEPLDLLSMYGSDLLTAFTSLFIQTKDDRDAGAPSHSLVSVSTRLAELLGDADTSSLHNLLLQYVVDNQFSELKLKDVATWAIEAREGSAYPAIAQQWWIASQMALLAKEVDSNERVDLVALRSSLLSQVQNETLSLASRHVSAVSLLSPKIAAEVGEIKTCMDVITEFVGKSGDEPSVTDWMFSIIVRLEGLEDGEQLKEVGGKFAATWERHATSAYKSGRGMTAALPSIRLYHRLDRPTGVQAVVRGLGENASRPEVVAELTRLGYANLAWSQLNRNWPQIDVRNLQIIDVANTTGPVSLGEIQVAFDPELEARLPELVALANHPGTKFLTQLYVSLLPDSADEALKPSVSRDERIAQLAAQYSDQTFVSADEQKLVVLLLAKAKELPAPIVTDIHTMADKLLPFDLWNRRSDNQVVERNRDLIALQIALHLRDGNQESLDKLMTQMETTDPDDYEKRNAVSRMVSVLADQLTKTIEAVDPEIIVAATPNLLKLESGNQYSRSGQLRGLLQIWFLVNDRGKEFADLVNQSSAGSGARPGASRSPAQDTNIDSLWPIAIRLKPGILEAEVEERAKFVKTIWELCKSGASVGSGHFQQGVKESCAGCRVAKMGLDAIEDAKLLTAAELIDYGPELARIDAVGGEIYRQIGHKLMAAEQWEEAASSLQRAISAGSRTMTAAKSNRQVEYAWALHKLDRKDEAKKVLGELESFELYGENPQRLSILKTELE